MKKVNGKSKGNKFERDISKKLSLYITHNENSDTVWRSISSGAFATNKQKKGIKINHNVGDLSSTSDESKLFFDLFNVECKSYKKVDLTNLFTNNCLVLDWYKKLYKDCSFNDELEYDKVPFLIYKQDFKPVIGVTTLHAFEFLFVDLIENNYCNYMQFTFEIVENEFVDIVLFKFDDFINDPYDENKYLNLKSSLIRIKTIKNKLKDIENEYENSE